MNAPETTRDVRMVMLVNKYATPLAILLVGLGLVFSQPVGAVKVVSASLLVFGVFFNLLAIPAIKQFGPVKPWLPRARMLVNISTNVVLVYCLGGYWPSIWLVLALTPIAAAIYDDRKKTFLTAVGISSALVAIQFLRKESTPSDWGELIGHVAFIVLLSLLINELAATARERA